MQRRVSVLSISYFYLIPANPAKREKAVIWLDAPTDQLGVQAAVNKRSFFQMMKCIGLGCEVCTDFKIGEYFPAVGKAVHEINPTIWLVESYFPGSLF